VRDPSFEVEEGDVLGVIGRNGAGKSTLLKLLSRITEPTEGQAILHGRVGSLLEVGTGFHPELTGRENIYLNGAVLGMSRAEVARKFDEIVSFSEVEKFIDTPVKRYSSGMYLRLAFAVASHLETEILIVDEVLAVGDLAFQKKCMSRIGSAANEGRTILFVSHNLGAIRDLCRNWLVLHNGQCVFHGSVAEALSVYSRQSLSLNDEVNTHATAWLQIEINGSSDFPLAVSPEDELQFQGILQLPSPLTQSYLYCIVHNAVGDAVLHQRVDLAERLKGKSGRVAVRVEYPSLWLAPGLYTAHMKVIGLDEAGHDVRSVSDRVTFDMAGSAHGLAGAILSPPHLWTVEQMKGTAIGAENTSYV
jgi:lipopolysaccharide transport system ATP-binding protein